MARDPTMAHLFRKLWRRAVSAMKGGKAVATPRGGGGGGGGGGEAKSATTVAGTPRTPRAPGTPRRLSMRRVSSVHRPASLLQGLSSLAYFGIDSVVSFVEGAAPPESGTRIGNQK